MKQFLYSQQIRNMQGFFVFHAYGGCTGSGVGVELLIQLRNQFPKKTIFNPSIFPSSEHASSVVEPYNAIFTTAYSQDTADLSLMINNQAAYRMCGENLKY
jgi:tubulin alpha